MKKVGRTVVLLMLALSFSLFLLGATPGTAADPLVTKSWVDQYVNATYDDLASRVDNLKGKLPSALSLVFTVNQNTAVADDGKVYTSDAAVLLYQNRTILPVRLLASAIGAELKWDGESKKATYIKGDKTIELYINKNQITVNGVISTIDMGATLHNNRTYVPLRVIMENFGYAVKWDNNAKTATVSIP